MKKIMIKALACGLAFTLALSTPVAVSAEGLSDIYTTSEKSENDTSTNTNTNTNTNTDTNSNAEVIEEETYAKVIGIVLDKEAATVEAGKTINLEATILIDNNAQGDTESFRGMSVAELMAAEDMIVVFEGQEVKASDLVAKLAWYEDSEVSYVNVTDNNDGTATVAGIAGGNTKVSVQLGDVYKATADVKVKAYSTVFALRKPEHAYVKHVYDMNDYLDRDGNENVTWRVYEVKNGKQVKATAATITKDGKLTIKKADKEIHVTAVSEKGKYAHVAFTTEAGVPVTKLTRVNPANGKAALAITSADANPTVTLEVGCKTKNNEATTDDITWTSKKANIATVEVVAESNGTKAIVTAQNPGKTTITATATSGKKITFTVTVTAKLEAIVGITSAKENIYNGQSVQLTAVKVPANASETVKFKINDKDERKIATVSAKGVLKANKKAKTGTVTVTAYYKKGATDLKFDQTFEIKAGTITAITIDNAVKNGKKNVMTLYTNKSFDFNAIFENGIEDMATWATNKAKVATVNETGITKALSYGKANITVSAVTPAGKTVKDTVAVTVKQPVTQIQLAKTDITVTPNAKKDQKIALKVSKQLPKGCTKEAITWEIVESNIDDVSVDYNSAVSKSASAKLVVPKTAEAGQYAVVKATAASGAKAIATITLCNKTSKVEMVDDTGAKVKTIELAIGETKELDKDVLAKVTAKVGKDAVVSIGEADAKAKNNEVVLSYTSNKNFVSIVDGTVYAVEPGTATITAKLASGKKATFKVKVVDNN